MVKALVLYDADCGLCSWSVNKLLAWDQVGGRQPRIQVVAIQSSEGQEWLGDLSPEARLASWHLVDVDARRRLSAGNAIAPVFDLMPYGAAPAFLANVFPSLTNWIYRWVSDHRTSLGKMLGVASCRVVQPPTDSVRSQRRLGAT